MFVMGGCGNGYKPRYEKEEEYGNIMDVALDINHAKEK